MTAAPGLIMSPVIIFAGRNPIAMLDGRPQQELDHVRLVRSITKWAQVVYDPARLGEYIETAARVALSGDPGPVLLEITRDVCGATVDEAAAQASVPTPAPTPARRWFKASRRSSTSASVSVPGQP